jgi:hypothetical protein
MRLRDLLEEQKFHCYTLTHNDVENGEILDGRLGDHYTGWFDAKNMGLTSLKGLPSIIDSSLDISNNLFQNLKGCTQDVGDLNISSNNNLISLAGIPKHLRQGLSMGDTPNLKSLEFMPLTVGKGCSMSNNRILGENKNITSFEGVGRKFLTKVPDFLITPDCLTSNILGILLIDGLEQGRVSTYGIPNLRNALKIIDKHLKGDKDILECQEELIEAGFKEYAKL